MKDEKPIECSGCKRKCTITYREIKEGKMSTTKYCSVCPLLKDKVITDIPDAQAVGFEKEREIVCSECHTNLQEVMTGSPLGCKNCYEIFEEFLTQELTQLGALPLSKDSALKNQKKIPLHLGNIPTTAESPDLSTKLRSLNSALHEALAIENYERAADLRDQIKGLMNQSHKE